MFISEAFAQAVAPAAGPAGGLDQLQQFLPFVLILVVFYFLMWRPQAKKAKLHKEMISQLRRGDKVILQSGIHGTVNKVIDEAVVLVEIAENVKVRVSRNAIGDVQAKTEPVAAGKDEPSAAEDDKK